MRRHAQSLQHDALASQPLPVWSRRRGEIRRLREVSVAATVAAQYIDGRVHETELREHKAVEQTQRRVPHALNHHRRQVAHYNIRSERDTA